MSEMQQAIFTSARSERMDGYQLVAASDGVTTAQRDELSAWGPAHDSLLTPDSRLGSVNFHHLASGGFCLSKTVPAGAEYSGRSGPRTYTTFLLLSPEQFQRFANQPFRVLDAAIAGGLLRVARRISDTLPTVKLRGRASPALTSLLEPLGDPDVRRGVLALGAAVCRGSVLVGSNVGLRLTLDRLFNLLPVECRTQLTFATGLNFSPQRPLRLQASLESGTPLKTSAKKLNAAVVDLESPSDETPAGWWAQVDELLQRGQFSDLIALLSRETDAATLEDLTNYSGAAQAAR